MSVIMNVDNPDPEALPLSHLAALVGVARHGSMSRAAQSLFISQPALTARIQRLESSVDAQLFIRSKQGTRLTPAGRVLLPYAERALASVERGREAVRAVASGGGGQLTIAAAPAVSTYVLPAMLHRFQAAHPRVRLSVRSGHSEDVLQMVLQEEVEIGLMRPIHHPDITSAPLYEDELVLVVHPGHPFARRGRIRMKQMGSERLILFDRTSSYHELTSSIFRQAGIAPSSLIEVDNIDAAKRMVEQRLGIALLPRTSVEAEIGSARLRPVVVSDMRPVRREIVVVRRRDAGTESTAVQAFLRTLNELRAETTRTQFLV